MHLQPPTPTDRAFARVIANAVDTSRAVLTSILFAFVNIVRTIIAVETGLTIATVTLRRIRTTENTPKQAE